MQRLIPLVIAVVLLQHHEDPGKLGVVHFANSCAGAVQPAFARGMALLHSFEFGTAIGDFKSVNDADPSCAIALWGNALSLGGGHNVCPRGQRPLVLM